MSVPVEKINYYTTLCEQLYNPKSSEERTRTEALLEQSFPLFIDSNNIYNANQLHLLSINTPTDTTLALRILLKHSPNPYVQVFCFSRLKLVIQAHFTLFDFETKTQLRSFLLEYAFIHPDLLPFVTSQLATVLNTITLMGWNDVESYRNIHSDMLQFITSTVDHRIIGMQILAIMVQDINPPNFTKGALKFRKTAGQFRDTQLLEIFKTTIGVFDELIRHSIQYSDANQERRLKEVTLNLLIKCLSYDFTGSSVDETAEDIGVIQIPSTWRPIFEKVGFLPTFFNAYSEFDPPLSSKVMECIVLISSVRKTVFSNTEERSKFILDTISGIRQVIINSQGLDDSDNYNEFCRLLYRFRATIPLNEMVNLPGYLEWLESIAGFSLKAFQSWRFAPNTSMYVLGFWSRVVQSMAYYKNLDDKTVIKLQNITVELVQSYISTVLEFISICNDEGLDDPLENEDVAIDTLDMLGQIAHCSYEKSASILKNVFNPMTVQYQNLIGQAETNMVNMDSFKEALELIETKFAWLVYMMGTFVGNRLTYSNNDKSDHINSELTLKVLQLINVQQTFQQHYGNTFSNQKLETAYIYFFQQFKKAYINESSGKDVYTELKDTFGVNDQTSMLGLITQKIITNLKLWANNARLISRNLDLFSDITNSHSTSSKLLTLGPIQDLLRNHFDRNLDFLQLQNQDENRILYFQAISRLFFSQDNMNEYMFEEFMKPFDLRFITLGELDTIETFQQDFIRRALCDIFIDLRGFISPLESRHHFILFFNWFFTQYSPILERAIEAWSPDPIVLPLLEFYAEFSHNKCQRLGFELSSANGILIFKTGSQILQSYGEKILFQQFNTDEERYEYKYKCVMTCFSIMCRGLGGRYVGFGALWLYQDNSINNALDIIIQLIQSIPLDDMLVILTFSNRNHCYLKMAEVCLHMIDEMTKEQLMRLPHLSAEVFVNIIKICENGVSSTNDLVRAYSCSSIFNICQAAIKQTEKLEKPAPQSSNISTWKRSTGASISENHWLKSHLDEHPSLLQSLLSTIFSIVLFDNGSDQWSLSKPLYGLMILQREYAVKFIDTVVSHQIPERREFVANALNKLLDGVKWNVTPKDREWFTQNISAFRKEIILKNITMVPLDL
ncbi:hypothetical protein K501DRAFT_255961 [Backusella circina FSU 941]|nr:hypothetical protein K501DRAFT_255961 [Backusella circina FSU 941]